MNRQEQLKKEAAIIGLRIDSFENGHCKGDFFKPSVEVGSLILAKDTQDKAWNIAYIYMHEYGSCDEKDLSQQNKLCDQFLVDLLNNYHGKLNESAEKKCNP